MDLVHNSCQLSFGLTFTGSNGMAQKVQLVDYLHVGGVGRITAMVQMLNAIGGHPEAPPGSPTGPLMATLGER